MLSESDWARMRADLADIVADNSRSIALRRAGQTLPAQTVRVVRSGSATRNEGGEAEASVASVLVAGDADLDIQPDDLFHDEHGALYRVVLVRPTRRGGVQAEARIMQ